MTSATTIDRLTAGLSRQGIDLSTWRPEFVLRRLRRAALLSGDVFVDRHVERLIADPEAAAAFLEELSVGVSEFFRDPGAFAFLEEKAIPELVRRVPHPRVLSLGCAQGQEPWSVAMLFAERGSEFEVLAVDRHPGFLASAVVGTYGFADVQRVTFGRAERWLGRHGDVFRVSDALRPRVRFEVHDLARGTLPAWAEPGTVDLVLCRNVFLYLASGARAALVAAIARALAPGGYLVLGTADRMLPHPSLSLVSVEANAFRRAS